MNNFVKKQINFLLQCYIGTGEYITGFNVQRDDTVIAYVSDGGHTCMWTYCGYINPKFCVDSYLNEN